MAVLHNTLFLSGWVWDPQTIITWQHTFWTRIKRVTTQQSRNHVVHTITDVMRAHMKFQSQWTKWSETNDDLDECIQSQLPDEEDTIDARQALQPMHAPHANWGHSFPPEGPKENQKGKERKIAKTKNKEREKEKVKGTPNSSRAKMHGSGPRAKETKTQAKAKAKRDKKEKGRKA